MVVFVISTVGLFVFESYLCFWQVVELIWMVFLIYLDFGLSISHYDFRGGFCNRISTPLILQGKVFYLILLLNSLQFLYNIYLLFLTKR